MIKILVMDVDGTLTDGKVYMGNTGELMKAFNIKDGYAIHDILPLYEIIPIIITGRTSAITENRCKELGVTKIYQGINNKIEKLQQVLNELGCSVQEVAYIGDDMNDYSCMSMIKDKGGVIGCPCDATDDVKKMADFVSKYSGGNGAVREMVEWLVSKEVNLKNGDGGENL